MLLKVITENTSGLFQRDNSSMLNRKTVFMIISMNWSTVSVSANSTELEFNSIVICDFEYLQVCENNEKTCDMVEVVNVDGVQNVHLDVEKMQFTTYVDKEITGTATIDKINRINHLVYIQGVNPDSPIAVNGVGWAAKIDKNKGEFSLAVLADEVSYLIFGTCHNQ